MSFQVTYCACIYMLIERRTNDYVVLLQTKSQRRDFVVDAKWMQSVYVTIFLATSRFMYLI